METKLFSVGEVKFTSTDDETMTFSGYGAVFNNTDDYGDVIAPGAFKKALKSGETPLMFLNHDTRSLPIGRWTALEEDAFGLKVTGQFIDTAMGRDSYTAAKANAISGLSIGYIPTEVKYGQPGTPEPDRLIKTAELLEISVVTFPANGKARIADVKSFSVAEDFKRALIALGMSTVEASDFLSAHQLQCEAKYIQAAREVAASNLLSTLQGVK